MKRRAHFSCSLVIVQKKYGQKDIILIMEGVIPAQDYQYLFDAGAVAVFGPGTKISEAAITILKVLLEE
ncbi:Methylmalonyl-CoA mutase large subunit [Flavobacterium limnosediminis JC2902]|uniref:Methylmalonyl-CoA mutase large subunit n=1 Tax=Flavobacterium limnosediminis JC2902 TaxID=1341181 RepID=V6SI35_9FLAO|nr:Methylmalonyl-CoA mutase large subunit [Flavobacterium limnosediminis JC2902]